MLIAQGAIDGCKVGLTIAIRYSAARPQFGNKIILDYLTHQRRLFPALAATYAFHIAGLRVKARPVLWTQSLTHGRGARAALDGAMAPREGRAQTCRQIDRAAGAGHAGRYASDQQVQA
jgi:hypothetical protein